MDSRRPVSLIEGFPPVDEAAWRTLAARAAGAAGLEALVSHTDDGIEIEPLYAPRLGNTQPDRAPSSGWPSAWDIVQPHDHPDPEEAGRQAREDLEGGASSVLFRFDRALGRGADRPDGVLVYDRSAFERLLAALPSEVGMLRIEAGPWALDRLSDLRALQSSDGTPAARTICVLVDPVSDALEGAAPDPRERIAEILGSIAEQLLLHLMADGRPWHEAGASEAQEIAVVLASTLSWLRHAEAAGIPLESVVSRLELVFAVDADVFLSLAKLRAARLCFERILEAADLGKCAPAVRIRAETGSRMLSRVDPWVNILRTTIAAHAAVVGGADALTVVPFDRPLGRASPLARRIARNIQLILREEAGVGRVRDPAAGSWYVAHLTRALAERAWERLQAIEAAGGLLHVLASGELQAEVEATRRAREKRIAQGREALIGVSAFPSLEEKPTSELAFDTGPAIAAARAALSTRPGPTLIAPFEPLRPVRWAEPFERLRIRAAAATAVTGQPPRCPVFELGRAGELYELRTRVENMLAAGGVAAERHAVAAPDEASASLRTSGRRAAILCVGPSAASRVAEVLDRLRSAGAERLWLAGSAEPEPAEVTPMGPDFDLLAFLEELHTLLDIPGALPGGTP
ncbi:MAG: methylmalonyl-CoA mutase [Geminicoccaceae bacterium]|nr:MAG: methylmalonyl-CoA mutase [Geminicoccaceae bacterium]